MKKIQKHVNNREGLKAALCDSLDEMLSPHHNIVAYTTLDQDTASYIERFAQEFDMDIESVLRAILQTWVIHRKGRVATVRCEAEQGAVWGREENRGKEYSVHE